MIRQKVSTRLATNGKDQKNQWQKQYNQLNYYNKQMSSKNIIMIVDNRVSPETVSEIVPDRKNQLNGSGFKSTQIDAAEEYERNSLSVKQLQLINSLRQRIYELEQRMKKLEARGDQIRKKKRIRRKNNQINKQFTCDHPECGKNYGSETSLRNHLKLKHRKFKNNTNEEILQ